VDVEWDPEIIVKYKNRIANIWKLILQLSNTKDMKNKNIDNWLISILNRRVQKITNAFSAFDLRVASNEIFFECRKDIRWYLKRGGRNKKILDSFVNTWIKLMTPIAPHIAEELWHFKKEGFVSNESYPRFEPSKISETDEVGEYLLSKLIDDGNEILKVTKMNPRKICVYVSPAWKWEIFRKALLLSSKGNLNVGALLKEAMSDPKMKGIAKRVSQFVGKLPSEIKKLSEIDRRKYSIKFESVEYLENAKDYLKGVFSCEVEIYRGDDEGIYDPVDKARYAIPLRPAIYLE
jgi:leucyl-tRNA synthetase